MNAALIRSACARRGMDYATFRRQHRARWKWQLQGVHADGVWRTEPWGVSDRNVGFDVTCACGWESRTGGAIHSEVRRFHYEHLLDVLVQAESNAREALS